MMFKKSSMLKRSRQVMLVLMLSPILIAAIIASYISWRFVTADMTAIVPPAQLCNPSLEQLLKLEKFKAMYKSKLHSIVGIDVNRMADVFSRTQYEFSSSEDYIIGLHAMAQAAGAVLFFHNFDSPNWMLNPILLIYSIDPFRIGYISPQSSFTLIISPRFEFRDRNSHILASLNVDVDGFGIPFSWPPRLVGMDSAGTSTGIKPNKCLPLIVGEGMQRWVDSYRAQGAK